MKQISKYLIYYHNKRDTYLQIFMRLCCETFVNWSCCKTETLLRRTYTFDLVYFLYASLLCISKEKTVWGTLLQTNTFLQSSDKKYTSPTLTQIKILGIYEKQKIKLDIFVNFVEKKTIF